MAVASKDTGYVDNWQTGKTVTECNLHMLTTEDFSDVTFRVGSEKHVVRAHRYVLVSRSCVFHAMFCGPLAEQGEITIPDIEPDVFREFLRYLYMDAATITADSVTGLLYTSCKYDVEGLKSQCTTFLEKSLSKENVCQILEQCHYYGDPDLEQKALEILTEAGEGVIKSPGFLDLCLGCLGKFLKSENLRLKEENVFEATLSWVKKKCEEEGVSVNRENIQKLLGDLKYEIRFAVMSRDYLVDVVGPSEVLSDSERVRIIERVVNRRTDISPFKSVYRKGYLIYVHHNNVQLSVQRFQSKPQSGMYMLSEAQAISVSVNRDILLEGCQLYGPYLTSRSDYNISVQVKDANGTMICEPFSKNKATFHLPPGFVCLEPAEPAEPATVTTTLKSDGLNDILFPVGVLLEAGSTYTLSVCMDGGATWYGEEGQQSIHVYRMGFTFSDSPESKGRTSVSRGQIPGLIFRRV